MAVLINAIAPVAHLPFVLGRLRKLEVAAVIDALLPPVPRNVLSSGRGVEALVLAILDGQHALSKVGNRLEARGLLSLLQADVTRMSLNDYRRGQILDALFAANLNRVFGAVALKALEVYAIPTPWLHQDTTTIVLYGAYADEPEAPGAPRPAYGHSKDGREDLKQVLLRLGVSGDGRLPLRMGMRDGNRSDSPETPVAIEECLALGLEGVRGIVADSKASSRRTLGLCLERHMGFVTLVPRTCAVRQDLEAWGQQQLALPLLVEKPGRTKDEEPRRWRGQSIMRPAEVEWRDGRVTQEVLRCVVVHSSQLAQQQAQTYVAAQTKEAQGVAEHVKRVEARRFACVADAEAARADYEGHGQGRRGRRPRLWRYHTVRYRVVTETRLPRRPRRGRPAKTDPPAVETCYGLVVEVESLGRLEEDNGWTVLAPTVQSDVGPDAAILEAYQEQHTTVEPGFRWIKNPAAISPVWLEKPERIAALAMLTVLELLVYTLIQRQVRLSLHTQGQQLPGNKGMTTMPTATVVFTLFSLVMMVHVYRGRRAVYQRHGVHESHWMVCDALGLDYAWYTAPLTRKNIKRARNP